MINNIESPLKATYPQTPRLRTVPQAMSELKHIDPDTAITLRALRRMVKQGEIPTINIASKHLIDMNYLMDKLRIQCYNENTVCASNSERSTT